MSKKALITGITGQDGSYLAEFLLSKGYKVFGFTRRSSTDPFMRLEHLLKDKGIEIIYGNMRDLNTIKNALVKVQPDEIYNLAAQSHVGVSFDCPEETMEVNYYGLGRIVNQAMELNKNIRIYQASTSEMFGSSEPPQSENTPFVPISPYAEAKLKAHEDFVVGYREKHGLFICSGILFNHESPRRGKQFVTRKISHSMAKIKLGLQDCFELGNLDSKRDWGFAGDYVEAMWMMLQQEKPDDFVISTGENHTVREFVEIAAEMIGKKITWEGEGLDEVGKDQAGNIIVKINEKFYRPTDPHNLLGDNSKAREILGWESKTSFRDLVKMMVEADLANLS